MVNITQFGCPHTGPWLQEVMEVLFWVYLALSVAASTGMYLILWSTQIFPVQTMTPVWVFPAYPLLLNATFATNLIATDRVGPDLPRNNRLPIAIAALTTQGTGFLISFMICAAFIYRLMTQKLPRDMQRPGVANQKPHTFSAPRTAGQGHPPSRLPRSIPRSLRPRAPVHADRSVALGAQRVVLHRVRGFAVEVHAQRAFDAVPDDVVEFCIPEHRARDRHAGPGEGDGE
ncbi:hypothetical protein NPX13_g11278 [Xylaria arbuscula]|uniref:Uncharacterized protein n=1 Tax=Xylaria arbuscula TaxID=114810 RepID=A0A9W8N328_9PEZI|nr:hypothetical protein NPX13_g11278 [Xylaria arbuscula]